MTVSLASPTAVPSRRDTRHRRFRLARAGVLNVWQYDDQEFTFADGRLLLRGANGAGKSKTLEMLLPFALDGDKSRLTASHKHHTSLLWLMTDGYDGQARVGYVWVELLRTTRDGAEEAVTCGVGIRASVSARQATSWHFVTSRRVGRDLFLEDEAGPLSRARLGEVLGGDGQVFDKAAAYKEHVGRTLFGLGAAQYDEVLRLLYWLRQPQVGEDIEPAKLAQQLSQALPQLDEQAVRSAGDTFDELTAYGEQIERRASAAASLQALAEVYAGYARAVVARRSRAVAEALREERRRRADVTSTGQAAQATASAQAAAESARAAALAGLREDDARLRTLQDSPEFRSQRRLGELAEQAEREATIAGQSERRRARQAGEVDRRAGAADSRRRSADQALDEHRTALHELDRRQRHAVPASGLPVPALLDGVALQRAEQLGALGGTLDTCLEVVRQARTDVSRRVAAVGLVRDALAHADQAAAQQRETERAAERAETRFEQARASRRTAEASADAEQEALSSALTAWAARPGAPPVALPDPITAGSVPGLAETARDAAAQPLDGLRREQAEAAARRTTARGEVDRLQAERLVVEAERDPAPPPPVLPRTERSDGHALWQVVDFAEGVRDDDRAGLEAALQAAGLLDAWVRPGGLLLDPEQRDVVLAPTGAARSGGALDRLLVPDLPAGTGLSTDDVSRLLACIGVGLDDDPDVAAWVRPDGTWRLGPAHGRAAKDRAQFVGATARAEERRRRLALIDAELDEWRGQLSAATDSHTAATEAIDRLEAWVADLPSAQALLQAWTRLEERRSAEDREEQDNRVAQEAAHTARTAAAHARASLDRLAAEHDLPSDRTRLDAAEQLLRSLDDDLADRLRRDPPLRSALQLWAEAVGELAAAVDALAAEEQQAAADAQRARESWASLEALRASVGDSVQELERTISDVRRSRRAHEEAERTAEAQANELRQRHGAALADARNAEQRLAEHLERRAAVLADLAHVGTVPGLLDAAGVAGSDSAVVAGLADHPAGEPVPRQAAATADSLSALSGEDADRALTAVWRVHADASSGPAADHQPTVVERGNLFAVAARDDAGEAAIVALAQRVTASVDRDRGLLSDREKQQFEQHVLGELGDAIRRCRRDADELVTAMNDQLGNVSTSQGIRVRLDWRLRDDVPAEARAAVQLLAQPVGALIPEERATLRDVLHRLIEASRAERPDLSYGEHLAAALDYRTWSEFTIRYTRPEKPGHWERLHRRSPLSQGEQKVLCYLPLFAAAAAHFTSLAGAAPHAPRLVLLDDAFPKIDVRTHPLLFGLLVQLDLDFVITSERLWGDHDTVPSLAIYEALRDPNQRGIAQYEYRWDGRALHALG